METNETQVLMKTNLGNIKLKLYNETPQHRDNFIKLVKKALTTACFSTVSSRIS